MTRIKSLIALFVLLATSLHGQTAREIVERYLDTVSNGDVTNWEKIRSAYVESEVYYSQQDYEQKVNLMKSDKAGFHKSFHIYPYSNKIEIYLDSAFTKLSSTFYYLENKSILLIGQMPPLIKTPQPRDEYTAAHTPLIIAKLLKRNKSIQLLGIREFPMEGVHCYEIEVITKEIKYLLYFNIQTFLLEFWKKNNHPALTKFSEYKKVGDLLVPMYDGLLQNGVAYYWCHKKKIEFNAAIDPKIFEYEEK